MPRTKSKNSATIDYKRELEIAARNMIMVHNPETLIKIIMRTIVKKVMVRHAGILLFDKKKNTYVLNISGGETGVKIPKGYARIDPDSPMIRFFSFKGQAPASTDDILLSNKIDNLIWKNNLIDKQDAERKLLEKVKDQMDMLGAVVCIPSYFQNDLLGILILGEKLSHDTFHKDELDFFAALASDVAMAIRNAQLFKELQRELEINRELFINTTIALAEAIDAKDHYTRGHTERVTQYSLLIAKKISTYNDVKLQEKFLDNLHIASLLHDIGKIAIPESVLNKPGKLTDEEFAKIKEHPERGSRILKPIKELKESIQGVKYHHERYDGKGYPEGIKGEKIPLSAAIICVADTFDAMTTDRPYRRGLSKAKAIKEINNGSGTQFNPLPAKAFVELYEDGKV